MAENNEDRGDDVIVTGDEPGDTGDLKEEGKVEGEDKSEDKSGAKGEDTGEDKGEDKGDEPRIPKSRFDQAVGKARAAEKAALEKAEKLEAELAASKGTVDFAKLEKDIDDLEDKLEDAIKDGNVEAKQRIRREIRQKNGQMAEAKAAAYSQHATAVAVEQIRYDALVERMEAEHPELNPDNEDSFDEGVVAEVMDYKSAFEAKGESSTVALKKALKAVYGNAKPAEKKEESAKKEEPAAKAEAKAAERKEEAVKKGLDAKNKQPSNEKAGVDSDKAGKSGKSTDVTKMSEKDFDKLDEDELKHLRGDNV